MEDIGEATASRGVLIRLGFMADKILQHLDKPAPAARMRFLHRGCSFLAGTLPPDRHSRMRIHRASLRHSFATRHSHAPSKQAPTSFGSKAK